MKSVWVCWRGHGDVTHRTRFGWPQCPICKAAPDYHERAQFVPDDFAVCVYVPQGRALAIIAPGSGVVGVPAESGDPGRTLVYFEGWINGAMQYADLDARGRWEAGLLHATDRMVTAYPTIAQAYLANDELKQIGRYFPKTREVVVDDEEGLNAWLLNA